MSVNFKVPYLFAQHDLPYHSTKNNDDVTSFYSARILLNSVSQYLVSLNMKEHRLASPFPYAVRERPAMILDGYLRL